MTYRFRDVWFLAAPAPAVFATVVDLAGYPRWWPDIRSVTRLDEETAELVCRATLPYGLVLRLYRVDQDEPAGRVAVRLGGDLEGSLVARLAAGPHGTTLDIRQDVTVARPLLRRLDPVARPLFRLNHALMMRRGLSGLRARLG